MSNVRALLKHFLSSFIAPILFFAGSFAMAASDANQSFTPDPNIQKIAEAYSQDAVEFAKKQFGITLDWSDASVADVEKALSLMHSSYASTTPKPTEEQVMSFAKGFGSYVGEVYRRNHGGTWGMVHMNGQSFPGMRTPAGVNFWPWGRASNRIIQGPQNNIADYYRVLLEK